MRTNYLDEQTKRYEMPINSIRSGNLRKTSWLSNQKNYETHQVHETYSPYVLIYLT